MWLLSTQSRYRSPQPVSRRDGTAQLQGSKPLQQTGRIIVVVNVDDFVVDIEVDDVVGSRTDRESNRKVRNARDSCCNFHNGQFRKRENTRARALSPLFSALRMLTKLSAAFANRLSAAKSCLQCSRWYRQRSSSSSSSSSSFTSILPSRLTSLGQDVNSSHLPNFALRSMCSVFSSPARACWDLIPV